MAEGTQTPGLMGGLRGKKDKIKDRKEKLTKEQASMKRENFHTSAEKEFKKVKNIYKKVDPGFKKKESDDDNILANIQDKSFGDRGKVFDEFKASNREAGRTSRAKGGRIGYKHGGAAKRGRGCEIK